MMLIVERQFLIFVTFIFTVPLLIPHMASLFMNSLLILICCQYLLWSIILLVLIIIIKNKGLRREKDITGLLKVTVKAGFLVEAYASREIFGFEVDLLGSTIIPTTVKNKFRECFSMHLDSLINHSLYICCFFHICFLFDFFH